MGGGVAAGMGYGGGFAMGGMRQQAGYDEDAGGDGYGMQGAFQQQPLATPLECACAYRRTYWVRLLRCGPQGRSSRSLSRPHPPAFLKGRGFKGSRVRSGCFLSHV